MASEKQQFTITGHAVERTLERTELSQSRLLDRLNSGAFVWLPRRYFARYALIYCALTGSFFVAVIAKNEPIVTTVLPLEFFNERRPEPVPQILLTLAQTATANALTKAAASKASVVLKDKPGSISTRHQFSIQLRLTEAVPRPDTVGGWATEWLTLLHVTGEELTAAGITKIAKRTGSSVSRRNTLQRLVQKLPLKQMLEARLGLVAEHFDKISGVYLLLGTRDKGNTVLPLIDITQLFCHLLDLPPDTAFARSVAAPPTAARFGLDEIFPPSTASALPEDAMALEAA